MKQIPTIAPGTRAEDLVPTLNDRVRKINQALADASATAATGVSSAVGLLAARPVGLAKENAGSLYFTTDTYQVYWWTGAGWTEITPGKPQAWRAPTLLNGWVNVGAPNFAAGYRIENQSGGPTLRLRGAISSGTTADNTVLFTLPVGYRSTARQNVCSYDVFNKRAQDVAFQTSGDVQIFGAIANAWIALDGITVPLS